MSDWAILGKSLDTENLKRGNMFQYYYEDRSYGIGKKEGYIRITDGADYEKYITEEEFDDHFIVVMDYFKVRHEYTVKKFVFNVKREFFLRFVVKNLSINIVKQLYIDIFFYLEQIKRKTPELLLSFESSIIDALDKLKKASELLDEEDFMEAVISAKPVFEEMYKMSLRLSNNNTGILENEKDEVVRTFLDKFKRDMNIRAEVLKDLNY